MGRRDSCDGHIFLVGWQNLVGHLGWKCFLRAGASVDIGWPGGAVCFHGMGVYRFGGEIGWIILTMIGFWSDEDCLIWDWDYHDVIIGCFVGGLIHPPVVGHGFDGIRF